MGMILRIASSRIVGQGDSVGRRGYFSLNLSANSVMRGRLDARRTLKSLVADLRFIFKNLRKSNNNSDTAYPCRDKISVRQSAVRTKGSSPVRTKDFRLEPSAAERAVKHRMQLTVGYIQFNTFQLAVQITFIG